MPEVIYNQLDCQTIQKVFMYNLLEETVLQPSWQHLNSSKIAIQQLSADLNISTVFSGALEQVTTCGVRAANQVYRESKVFDSYIDYSLQDLALWAVREDRRGYQVRLRKSRSDRSSSIPIMET
jgi:hypothetical protein